MCLRFLLPCPPRRQTARNLAGLILVGCFSTGCDQEPPASASPSSSSASVDAEVESSRHHYTVRGKVVELPAEGDARGSFRVHHEAIDDFRNPQGEVVGMSSMAMPFPPAEGLDLGGLKVGDKVELDFTVDWSPARRGWFATAVRVLPSETELEFEAASAPATNDPATPPPGGDS